jgi:hypothetical protein
MTVRNAESMGAYGASWQARGYSGHGDMTPWVQTLAGRTAVVCGNGAGVLSEVAHVRAVVDQPVWFAVNDIGMYLHRVDHWVSLHADHLPAWRSVRWLKALEPERTVFHSGTPRPWLDAFWDRLTPQLCLSGYFAMQIAWVMGADRIILCGCPGDNTARFFDAVPRQDFSYGDEGVCRQMQKEMDRLPDFKAAVRSMSGWTQTYFGGL